MEAGSGAGAASVDGGRVGGQGSQLLASVCDQEAPMRNLSLGQESSEGLLSEAAELNDSAVAFTSLRAQPGHTQGSPGSTLGTEGRRRPSD